MRKVTKATVGAFMLGIPLKMGNTESTGEELLIYDNEIAWHVAGGLMISTCGWNTVTTRERLNALPNVKVWQKNYQLYLQKGNCEPIEWSGNPEFIAIN